MLVTQNPLYLENRKIKGKTGFTFILKILVFLFFSDQKVLSLLQRQVAPVESPDAWSVGGPSLITALSVLFAAFVVDMVTFSRYFTVIVNRYKDALTIVATVISEQNKDSVMHKPEEEPLGNNRPETEENVEETASITTKRPAYFYKY